MLNMHCLLVEYCNIAQRETPSVIGEGRKPQCQCITHSSMLAMLCVCVPSRLIVDGTMSYYVICNAALAKAARQAKCDQNIAYGYNSAYHQFYSIDTRYHRQRQVPRYKPGHRPNPSSD